MTTLIELTQRIFFFEGVAFVLLSAIVVSRWFFRQPIDRIRLTQLGFGLITVAAVCIGYGIGPTWTIVVPPQSEFASEPQLEGCDPIALATELPVRNAPHPNPLPEEEGTTEQRALSSTDSLPLLRPYETTDKEALNPVAPFRYAPGLQEWNRNLTIAAQNLSFLNAFR